MSKQTADIVAAMRASIPTCFTVVDEDGKKDILFTTPREVAFATAWCDALAAHLEPKVEHFDEFWALYPRKVGKPMALKAFIAMKAGAQWPAIKTNIEDRIRLKNWKPAGDDLQYIPHASTYLRQLRWLDPIEDRRKPEDKGQWFERGRATA